MNNFIHHIINKMSVETINEFYKIKFLIDFQNYQAGKMIMKNILSINDIMKIVDGFEIKFFNFFTKFQKDFDYDVIKKYERRFQNFENKIIKGKYKSLKACDRIKLACKNETLIKVKNKYLAKNIGKTLKKFNFSNKFLFKIVQKQLFKVSQSEHKSVYEYEVYIKKTVQNCVNVDKKFENGAFRNFFIQSLNADFEIYIIPKKQIAEKNKKKFTLNDMIKTLIEYEIKMKNQNSKTKILA